MRKAMWSVAAVVVLFSLGGMAAVRAAGTTVSMVEGPGDPTKDWRFDPADITVPAGSTVTWHNSGQQPHTVTADDGSFKSDYVSPGGTFQHAFATPGTYAYHCEPHPWMKAVVHVTGGSTPSTAAATTPTTQAAASPASTSTTATTARTAAAASSSTTAPAPAAGGATTTTTAASTAGSTTTTAAGVGGAPSAAPATDVSTTTTGAAAEQAAAGGRHGSQGGKTNAPLVTLAGLFTLLLVSVTMRLLAAKT